MGTPIDLSAGLVKPPAAAAGPGPGPGGSAAGGIDLSAGLASTGQETAPAATNLPRDPYWLGPALEDVGIGAVKSLAQPVNALSKGLRLLPGGKAAISEEGVHAADLMETPHGPWQYVGMGLEQALEWVSGLKALGALSAAEKIGLAESLVGKVGETALKQALLGGAQTFLHGGGVGETAVGIGAGGLAGGLSELAAVRGAPKAMEAGLGISWEDRLRTGKQVYAEASEVGGHTPTTTTLTPGRAAMELTGGYTPGAISREAAVQVHGYTQALEGALESAPDVSLAKPLDVLAEAKKSAEVGNDQLLERKINVISKVLTRDLATKQPMGETVPARRALELKRTIGRQINSWRKINVDFPTNLRMQVYGALDSVMDEAAPGTSEINDRIHNLILVRDRAKIEDLKAGIIQQVVAKLTRPTGALTGAVFGAKEARARGAGTEGEIVGGFLGLAAGSILGSPTTLISLARLTGKSPTAVGVTVREVVNAYQMANRPSENEQ